MNSKKPTPQSRSERAVQNVPVSSRNLLQYHLKSKKSEGKGRQTRKLKLSASEYDGYLGALTKESKRCLKNLAAYRPPKDAFPQPWLPFPRSRRAAVLVALFVGRKGDLYVLLSKRASTLRSFAGDTSLPGGKMDMEDESIEHTARREAFEEIGLPLDPSKAPLLCMLEPFYVEKQLLVTPVVVLILDNTLQPILNSTEVTALFSHPLASFLSSTPPASIIRSEPELVELGGEDSGYRYHVSNDWEWDGPPVDVVGGLSPAGKTKSRARKSQPIPQYSNTSESSHTSNSTNEWDSRNHENLPATQSMRRRRKVRMHRFLTGREAGGIKPVYGLTAAIMIHTARIGFSPSPPALATPDFEMASPDSPSMVMRIAWAFCRPSREGRPNLLREALEEEGLADKVDWERVRKVAGFEDRDWRSGGGRGDDIRDTYRGRTGEVGDRHRRSLRIRSKL